MKGLVISTKTESDFRFISGLLKKLGIPSIAVTREDIEDMGLSLAMKAAIKSKKVSRERVLRKLAD